MTPVSQVVQGINNSYSNGGSQSEPTIAIAIEEQDKLIEWARDLIDPRYRLWFITRLKVVGKRRFVQAADAARKYDGVSRQKVFSHLLKT